MYTHTHTHRSEFLYDSGKWNPTEGPYADVSCWQQQYLGWRVSWLDLSCHKMVIIPPVPGPFKTALIPISFLNLAFLWNVESLSHYAAAAAKSLQSCPTLCDSIGSSPPGSPVPGILQARTLEWVAISFSNAWKWKVKGKALSCVGLLATPWTAAHQAPLSMGFSRQEYWSGVPSPSPLSHNCLSLKPLLLL